MCIEIVMKKIVVILLAISFLFSCQSEPDSLKLFDELVVSTNYDAEAAFGTYSTYAIPTDTIGFVSDRNPNDTILISTSNNGHFPRRVLQQIMQNLNDRSFTRIDRKENPDLAVNVYIVNDLNLFQQVVYPNYYYPYYYGYGSFYSYPFINTYAYNTGALVVELVDLKNVRPGNQVKVVWNAYMGDVYSTVNLADQAVKAIDQAFIQSNYLVSEN
jgi:hypothetical protein